MYQFSINKLLNIILYLLIFSLFSSLECEYGYCKKYVIYIYTNLKQNQIETEPKLNFKFKNNLPFKNENTGKFEINENLIELSYIENTDLLNIDSLKFKININNEIVKFSVKIYSKCSGHTINFSVDSQIKNTCEILDTNYYYYKYYYEKYLDTINNLYICSYWNYAGE